MVYVSQQERILKLQRENVSLQNKIGDLELIVATLLTSLAEKNEAQEEIIKKNSSFSLSWAPDTHYIANNIRKSGEGLYKCLQAHISQEGEEPEKNAPLWVRIDEPLEEAESYRIKG